MGLPKYSTQLYWGKAVLPIVWHRLPLAYRSLFTATKATNSHRYIYYREEMVAAISTATALALKVNQQSRRCHKQQYDKKLTPSKLKVDDWVLVYFPQDEAGKLSKLSQPWQDPYRITSKNDPDVTLTKIYFSEDEQIQVY